MATTRRSFYRALAAVPFLGVLVPTVLLADEEVQTKAIIGPGRILFFTLNGSLPPLTIQWCSSEEEWVKVANRAWVKATSADPSTNGCVYFDPKAG